MLENTTDLVSIISNIGPQGAMVVAFVWFGKRFLALNDVLLGKVDRVLSEMEAARHAMDLARREFELAD